jgi:hypothetical protein
MLFGACVATNEIAVVLQSSSEEDEVINGTRSQQRVENIA